ncbi:hypothetical protein [Acidithiobacillus albertensis]|uniref:hypothetical protein n=1 Tax=Acidithiobacillus albertensis TaxID=119978 RepID=UPI001C06C209|nr:hypothetical protein [Acidithiobacillus albertensis]MBU2740131.1 hypothetical protein [Acidithiobacillus albertensis]
MSILLNCFTPLDEAIAYMSDAHIVPQAFAGFDGDLSLPADPCWRRGFFMAMQAAPFWCPPNHPMVMLAGWMYDLVYGTGWSAKNAALAMADGDCDALVGENLEKAEAGAAVVWQAYAALQVVAEVGIAA